MDSTQKKRFNSANETLDSDQSPPQIFQFLLSAIEDPDGLKPSLLKSVYCLLVHLSSNPLDTEIGQYGIKVTFKDIYSLSSILLKELCKRFEQFFSNLPDASATRALGQARFHSDMWAVAEELKLLLRCCMVILNLLVPKQYLLLENGRVLLAMLRKLCSLDPDRGNEKNAISFSNLVSREYTYRDNDCMAYFTEEFVVSLRFLELSDPRLPFLCTMLEVFADELLVHGQLREYFNLIDSVSSTSEMLFVRHSHGDIGSVMEMFSTHFSLSFSDEQAFENYLKRLFWLHGKDYRCFELSLAAAISLLLNTVILSAPKFFQAHLISLVSEATGIGINMESIRPNLRLMDCYLSAFEKSVILYTKHMSSMQMDGHPTGAEDCFVKLSIFRGSIQSSFESSVQPFTRNKINNLISKLDNSWHSHLHNMFFRTKSDLVTTSIAYIKENQHVLDISCRDEIVSILSCIILGAYSGEVYNILFNANGEAYLQDICLLASILKLMSTSLLQAIWCLRHGGNLGSPRTLKNFSSCKEYDFIAGVVSCFKKFNVHLPIQKSLRDVMAIHPTRHKESKLMLLHFSGLLSLCFVSGLDFLVKGCILTMMTLMNLFIFEEGNLEAFKLLIDSKSESSLSGLPPDDLPEVVVNQRSSLTVVSKFQKIQTLYLSAAPLASNCTGSEDGQSEPSATSSIANNMEHVVGIEEEKFETCNGEIFLNCILEHANPSDIDDLADFIECRQGKDYSCWLKDRQRYRKWKCEKRAVLRWEKKRKTWKYMEGKRT